MHQKWFHRVLHDHDRGANLVELALVLPILLGMLVAIVDFGRAYYTYIIVTNAAREGARYASTHPEEETQWPLVLEVVDLYGGDHDVVFKRVDISTGSINDLPSIRVDLAVDYPTIIGSFVGYPTIEIGNHATMPILSYPG